MVTPEIRIQYQPTPLAAEKGRLPVLTEAIVEQVPSGLKPDSIGSELGRNRFLVTTVKAKERDKWKYRRGSGRSRRERCTRCGQKHSSSAAGGFSFSFNISFNNSCQADSNPKTLNKNNINP